MKPLKVLIVDDDPPTCSLLETILKMEGCQTASAHEIEDKDLLALLKNEQPDILVLDYHLNSHETLAHLDPIRNDPRWAGLGILMMSGVDYSEECLAAGADDFVLKPFDWQDMTAAIDKISKKIS